MTGWIIGGLLLFIGLLVLWRKGKEAYVHRRVEQSDLKRYAEVLLIRGRADGFMVLHPNAPGDNSRFLQFAKRSVSPNRAHLDFVFPLAPWSEIYLEALRETLVAEGVTYQIRPTTGGEEVRGFLHAPMKSTDQAQAIAVAVLQQVFGLGAEITVNLVFEGVDPR